MGRTGPPSPARRARFGPSGASRHLPMNGEDTHLHKWEGQKNPLPGGCGSGRGLNGEGSRPRRDALLPRPATSQFNLTALSIQVLEIGPHRTTTEPETNASGSA